MLATLIIVFREVIEAGLVIGIVLAATRGVPRRGLWIGGGVIGGIAAACLVAASADAIANMVAGSGQELFNASVMAIAVLMLTGHNVWMAREGRHMAQEMQSLGNDVVTGRRSLTALAIVVGVAVMREGSEIVLFLYGIALSAGSTANSMFLGGAIGLALGAVVSATVYLGLMRIPTRHVFAVTSWLIALLAAGMASQATVFLQQAGLVTVLSHVVWDTSGVLSDGSLTGKALHTLVGYADRPTGIQLVAYAVTLLSIFTLMRLFGHAPQSPRLNQQTQLNN
ncbi:ferrous iron permease EfeU [mine drainage metagenome]|uniref:Ferrous iron permease EfeU n=1 Tax=mine drainage metagenome TaxID=410659 RepID=A0A1J5RJB1_9ZZZZ